MNRNKKLNILYEIYQSSMKCNKKYLGSQKKWELLQIEDVVQVFLIFDSWSACAPAIF